MKCILSLSQIIPWFICAFDCDLFARFFLLRRNCEQHITSSNSHMVWSGVEVFDGKLLGLRSIGETIILRDFSETEKHGCCNQCEIIPVPRRSIFISRLSLWQKRGKYKQINKWIERFLWLMSRHRTEFSNIYRLILLLCNLIKLLFNVAMS